MDTEDDPRRSIGLAGLKDLMRDPRYWNEGDPDHRPVVDLITRGIGMVYDDPPAQPRFAGSSGRPATASANAFANALADRHDLIELTLDEQTKLGRATLLQALEGEGLPMPYDLLPKKQNRDLPKLVDAEVDAIQPTRPLSSVPPIPDRNPMVPPPLPSHKPNWLTPWVRQANAADQWPQSSVAPAFREAIHVEESNVYDYQSVNSTVAWGRYQLEKPMLVEVGILESVNGPFTGRYGVHSFADFLNNPEAQEKAFEKALDVYWHHLGTEKAISFIGRQIHGANGAFVVTEDGLLAAAHKEGAHRTKQYLEFQEAHGWHGDVSKLPARDDVEKNMKRAFDELEKRLLKFQNIPHRRP